MTTWLANTRDTFKTQLWPIPTIAVVAELLIGLGLLELDSAVSEHLSGRVSGVLFGGDADAARSLVSTIASSLITVTALTFSLTVVTLQLASDQFVQATLALFLATFTYALTVLRAVRSASRTMRAVLPERDRADGDEPHGPRPPLDAAHLLAHDDGFLTWIEQSDLAEVAEDEDALLSLDVSPGSYVVKGTPVGAAWPGLRWQLRQGDGRACLRQGRRMPAHGLRADRLPRRRLWSAPARRRGEQSPLARNQRPDHGDPRPGSHLGLPV